MRRRCVIVRVHRSEVSGKKRPDLEPGPLAKASFAYGKGMQMSRKPTSDVPRGNIRPRRIRDRRSTNDRLWT